MQSAAIVCHYYFVVRGHLNATNKYIYGIYIHRSDRTHEIILDILFKRHIWELRSRVACIK